MSGATTVSLIRAALAQGPESSDRASPLMAPMKPGGRLGAAPSSKQAPAESTSATQQRQPLAVVSASRHRASRISGMGRPPATMSSSCFSPASRASARPASSTPAVHLRSSMSVLTPHHPTNRPEASTIGLMLNRNQRCSPSWRRRRACSSPPSPEVSMAFQPSSHSCASSGWIAERQPSPSASSGPRPVYSLHRRLMKSLRPSGSAVQTSPGSASTTRLSSFSITPLSRSRTR